MKKLLLLLMALAVLHGALAQAGEAPNLDQVLMPTIERPAASTAGKGGTRALAIKPTWGALLSEPVQLPALQRHHCGGIGV